jgi:hypothetical protein
VLPVTSHQQASNAFLEAELDGARPLLVLPPAARPARLLRHRRLLPRRLRLRRLQGCRAPRRDRRPRLRSAAHPHGRLPPLLRAQLAPQVLGCQGPSTSRGAAAGSFFRVGGAVGRGAGGGAAPGDGVVPVLRALHVVQAALGLRLLILISHRSSVLLC